MKTESERTRSAYITKSIFYKFIDINLIYTDSKLF